MPLIEVQPAHREEKWYINPKQVTLIRPIQTRHIEHSAECKDAQPDAQVERCPIMAATAGLDRASNSFDCQSTITGTLTEVLLVNTLGQQSSVVVEGDYAQLRREISEGC